MASNPSSGASTPNTRFKSQSKTVEDVLATQTVGLVNLTDFRKRRAEALEQKDRDAHDALLGSRGSAIPSIQSGTSTPTEPLKKKKKKKNATPKLSFVLEDEDEGSSQEITPNASRSQTASPMPSIDEGTQRRKMAANTSVGVVPKPLTKRSLLQESQTRETLRKEFMQLQERVKAAHIAIPFVFFDGSNIPGGVCKVKKGDFVWVFLDGSRKVGADGGVDARGEGGKGEAKATREWARIGVDDLMLVRGSIIIPHHYDFYYFIMNRTLGPNGRMLFDYSAKPSELQDVDIAAEVDLDNYNPLSRPSAAKEKPATQVVSIADLEGATDEATFTKVVDRRWYEKNKHIFPASVWQEFDPEKDYQKEVRRDAGGNAFFFS